jgi:hypothetical protein
MRAFVLMATLPALAGCPDVQVSTGGFVGRWTLTSGHNVATCAGAAPRRIDLSEDSLSIADSSVGISITWSMAPLCTLPAEVDGPRAALLAGFRCELGDDAFSVRTGALDLVDDSTLSATIQTTAMTNSNTCDGDFSMTFTRN